MSLQLAAMRCNQTLEGLGVDRCAARASLGTIHSTDPYR